MAPASRSSDSPKELQTLPPIHIHEKAPLHVPSSHPLTTQYQESQQLECDYPPDDDKKVFSFVALPGINSKKRPRRKFDEIERLYGCNWQGCNKSYGTLNHLNAHVMMQKHGSKRLPNEFKELRKNWKKQRDDSN
ncbi:hypothetical protein K493DRAFT_232439 [Basidiobolus meristosporus CBS 931.73]|uniref:C2H2-type domain-containing protein n=1 Tax=Basidiobolus meristosporus CBS 931.73 TaxID=1314790 RepID=A0A1Y1XWC0_9FUNG|nr:hypothetical protein K493DRAFT_232439 [Basidiobolus meristosporus CBS 931.73]|eukprot:ORX89776.1 hypothetical protein K493DRAFT_232439 [Basidiobolus meristosporus CBS 931.73]